MVEFTIVLPIFLMLVLGIAQLGIAFNNYLALTDGVRAAPATAPFSGHRRRTMRGQIVRR